MIREEREERKASKYEEKKSKRIKKEKKYHLLKFVFVQRMNTYILKWRNG